MKNILILAVLLLSASNVSAQYAPGEPAYGNGYGMYKVERRLHCASNNHQYAECSTRLERTGRVYMIRQVSKASCVEGHSYSVRGDRITVWNGCRADFAARGFTRYPESTDQILEQPQMKSVRVVCESHNYNTATCGVPLNRVREVYLVQQLSKTSCIQGHNYFVSDRYIQVSGGCRGVFEARGY